MTYLTEWTKAIPYVLLIALLYFVYAWGRQDVEAKRLRHVADSTRQVAEEFQKEVAERDSVIAAQQRSLLLAWDSLVAVEAVVRNLTPPEALERSVSDEDVMAVLDTANINEGVRELIQGLQADNQRLLAAYDTVYAAYTDLSQRHVDFVAESQRVVDELVETYEERLRLANEAHDKTKLALEASTEAMRHTGGKWMRRIEGAVVGGLIAYTISR